MYQLTLVVESLPSEIRAVEGGAQGLAWIIGLGVLIAMVEGDGVAHSAREVRNFGWMIRLIQCRDRVDFGIP